MRKNSNIKINILHLLESFLQVCNFILESNQQSIQIKVFFVLKRTLCERKHALTCACRCLGYCLLACSLFYSRLTVAHFDFFFYNTAWDLHNLLFLVQQWLSPDLIFIFTTYYM